ncbi:MAG: hypothetical protein CMJ18_11475 [Phycisphaeraceae bacterium]|nr:hypothetical protein [Phycisphaeraceae bacterium]
MIHRFPTRFASLVAFVAVVVALSLVVAPTRAQDQQDALPLAKIEITTDVSAMPGVPVPEALHSIAKIRKVGLELAPLQPIADELGIDDDDCLRTFQKQIEQLGFKVSEDAGLPRVKVQIVAMTDPDQEESVSVFVLVTVHQRIVVERLKRRMTTPTIVLGDGRLSTRKHLDRALENVLTSTARSLATSVRLADAVQ